MIINGLLIFFLMCILVFTQLYVAGWLIGRRAIKDPQLKDAVESNVSNVIRVAADKATEKISEH